MGYSMKTEKYRYTEWVRFSGAPSYEPNWNRGSGVELYDHEIDSEENYNKAYDSQLQGLVSQLSDQLHSGWRAALPTN